MASLTKHIPYIVFLAGLGLALSFVMARGQLFPFPLPGTRVTGLLVSAYDVQGFLLVVLALAIAGVLLIPRLARGLDGSFLLKLLIAAYIARMLGAAVRLWTGMDIFGFSDEARYNRLGQAISNQIWHLEFGAVVSPLQLGTKFANFYMGVVYSIIGPSMFGAYFVFGLFSFLGSYFFYRAFRVAFPESPYKLYGLLVFFYPALVYWPNGIGKDALMILFLGLAAYGSAIVLVRGRWHGLLPLTIGLVSSATVRPDVTLALVAGLVAAFLLRKLGPHKSSLMIRGLMLVAAIGLMSIIIPSIVRYVGLEDLSVDAVTKYYEYQQANTSDAGKGDAAFEPTPIRDPLFVPMAFVTVFFRPFPWEAHRLAAVIQAFDGILLMGLMIWRAPNLGQAILGMRSSPYVIFIIVFVVLLVFALANFANFGPFSRYRTMLFPLFFMLFAFAPLPDHRDSSPMARTI